MDPTTRTGGNVPKTVRRSRRWGALAGLMSLLLVVLPTARASAGQQTTPRQLTAITAALPSGFDLPVAATNGDGRLEVFSIGWDYKLWHNWQVARNVGPWHGWVPLGTFSEFTRDFVPAVGMNADGRLEVFAVDNNLELWHSWQLTAGGDWSAWANLSDPTFGYVLSDPVVVRDAYARLAVFVTESTPNGHEVAFRNQLSDGWGAWQGLAPGSDWYPIGSPQVGVNDDGRLEVFVSDQSGNLRHNWELLAGLYAWSGWASLGGYLGTMPVVGTNSNGRLEIFTINLGTEETEHIWQLTGGGWSGWARLSSGTAWEGNPAVGRNRDGRLEIFTIRASDNSLWHNWQDPSTGTGWSGFQKFGGGPWTRSASVGTNDDGRLEVFAVSGGLVLHRWQDPSTGSGWGPWTQLS